MLCLRCGRCCIDLDIFIINTLSILPDGSINPEEADKANGGSMIFKPAGEVCPHLKADSRLAVCTIHHLPCYRDSPCDRFDQIGPEDTVCIMSGYFRSLDGSPQP
jgi:hypothetical protein